MTRTTQHEVAWAAFARLIIERAVRGEDVSEIAPAGVIDQPHGGVFVTLHELGRLRGCMGVLDPDMPLTESLRRAAVNSATQDPRFAPVKPTELPDIEVEVSILTPPIPMKSLDELRLGQHGIIVRADGRRGLFLPQVATDHHLDKETFLSRCCAEKADLPPNAWRDGTAEVLLFTTQVFTE